MAGTKGKGSTAAITESIVRHHGYKTGLFTSPHLVTVRERIKINGKAISEEKFVEHFWNCWDKLESSRCEKWPLMPGWFRYLTLLSFKIFQEENVECAVIEVGMGGRGDSTNILTVPSVCGITLLDYDHTEVLGNTLTEIAGEKAGIFKKGSPAITVSQTEESLATLRQKAIAAEVPLLLADTSLESFTSLSPIESVGADKALGLSAGFIKTNAVLAIALAETWLSKWHPSHVNSTLIASSNLKPLLQSDSNIPQYTPHALHPLTIAGIKNYHWPGRAQIHTSPTSSIRIFLDGAHTSESMKACIGWYSDLTERRTDATNCGNVLLFNCNKPRDPRVLLTPIVEAIASGKISFDFVYFTMSQVAPQYRKDPSNDISYSAHTDTTWQREMAGMWSELVTSYKHRINPSVFTSDSFDSIEEGGANGYLNNTSANSNGTVPEKSVMWPQVKVVSTINEAIDDVNSWTGALELGPTKVDLLATGSLYLVGALLEFMKYPTDQ